MTKIKTYNLLPPHWITRRGGTIFIHMNMPDNGQFPSLEAEIRREQIMKSMGLTNSCFWNSYHVDNQTRDYRWQVWKR